MDFLGAGIEVSVFALEKRQGGQRVSSQQVLLFSTEMWGKSKPSCQAFPLSQLLRSQSPLHGQVMPTHLQQIFAGRKGQQSQGISIP